MYSIYRREFHGGHVFLEFCGSILGSVPNGANLTAYGHRTAKVERHSRYVGMGVESNKEASCDETHSHTQALTHSHTWRDDKATKFDDLGLS